MKERNSRRILSIVCCWICVVMAPGCRDGRPGFGLAIGDSHGALAAGWVKQLKALRPQDSIMNVAVSGNTIGFDNLGKPALNELKTVRYQLAQADNAFNKVDYIIVLLGTNDCKAVFDSLQVEVPENLEKLLSIISTYSFTGSSHPLVILASPPPIGDDRIIEEKYHGAQRRLRHLLPHYQRIATKFKCRFADVHTMLMDNFDALTADGVHLSEGGYQEIARVINRSLPDQ